MESLHGLDRTVASVHILFADVSVETGYGVMGGGLQ